jgi:hypothetical protein
MKKNNRLIKLWKNDVNILILNDYINNIKNSEYK